MVSNKIKKLIIITIIAVIGAFYLLTIREGHDWGGDFSMHIHHAKNIAEGIDYKDTGYIYNPFNPYIGPKTYPPVFPALLSFIYKWFGLNLTAMKIEIILMFLLSLFIIFLNFKNDLPFQYLVVMIALIGFNPFFWNLKDSVLSDTTFLFFSYLALFSICRADRQNKSRRYQLLYAILIGFLIYLAYGTRSIGIVLIPCLFIYDIIRFKRATRFTIVATFSFLFFMILQNVFLHSDSSYFDIFVMYFRRGIMRNNLSGYIENLAELWDNGYIKKFSDALYVIISCLAIIGYLIRIKDRITIFEIFLPLYAAAVIVWPTYQGTRYLIPVIPLYILYFLKGIDGIKFFRLKKIERPVFIILIAAVFASYAAQYSKMDYGPIREGIGKKEAIDLFGYVKEKTGEKDVFIFLKPRVLALFAGRRASAYHCTKNDKDLWSYFNGINAAYIIKNRGDEFLSSFIERNQDSLQEVYSNSDFKVYKILRPKGAK